MATGNFTLKGTVPVVQSAIRPRSVRAALRPNRQPATRKVQTRFTRPSLEVRGPKDGLESGPRSSRG
eukprot:12713180-Alexandrium_andersonii.AAC.1